MNWTLARRAERLNPSAIREILKLTERPGIVSLAGGLPSADTFPVAAMQEATARVLREQPREALQYAASEGLGPLREWVVAELATQGLQADASQVLITTGSQQGLDLVGKVLIDPGSTVAVESPTYLGALQAFAPYEPEFLALAGDDDGPLPAALQAARGARLAYLLPNFQNPTGRCLGAARRLALVQHAAELGLPIVEDNPYGELWFDEPPPPPLAAAAGLGEGGGAVYLGSFSKVLAPGLRLGYLVAPRALYPKLLQAKQAADLHSPGFNQRVVHEVIKNGFLREHVPTIRARYRAQRDAMQAALAALQAAAGGPGRRHVLLGRTAPQLDATALLPLAVEAGMAYVPGAPFFHGGGHANTLRLSFVTATPAEIDTAVAALARVLAEAIDAVPKRAGLESAEARCPTPRCVVGVAGGPSARRCCVGRPCRRVHGYGLGGARQVPQRWPYDDTLPERNAMNPATSRRFDQLDVFSSQPLMGNPLAVVHDAQGLSDAQMADIARWTNLSETTFLLPPTTRGRLPRAHLHARRRTALCRPPHAGQLPRLAGRRRPAAGGADRGAGMWRGPGARAPQRQRAAGLCRATLRRSGPLDEPLLAHRGRHRRGAGPRRLLHHQWVDNGPGWCAVMLRRCGPGAGRAARLGGAGRHPAGAGGRSAGGRGDAVRGACAAWATVGSRTPSPAA